MERSQPETFSDKYVCTIRAFDHLWGRLERPEFLDLQMIPRSLAYPNEYFRSMSQAMDALERLREEADPDSEIGRYARTNLTSTITYAKAWDGEHYSSKDYAELINAATFEPPTELDIIDSKNAVEGWMKEVVPGSEFSRDGWDKLGNRFPYDRNKMMLQFRAAQKKFAPFIKEVTGEEVDPNYYKPNFIDHTGPWVVRIIGGPRPFSLDINTNPQNAHRWSLQSGMAEYYALHEAGGHLTQAIGIKRRIENGQLDRIFGLTTIPSPVQPLLEGVANNLQYLVSGVGERMTPMGRLCVKHANHRSRVFARVYDIVNSGRASAEAEAQDLLEGGLPSEPRELFPVIIDRYKNNLRYMGYTLAYVIGDDFIQSAIEKLDEAGVTGFTKHLYDRPHIIAESNEFVKDRLLQAA